ncbi:MAG: NADH-quinone oxidoreductase subunit A, partial [Motilibacteraceae bacterium]
MFMGAAVMLAAAVAVVAAAYLVARRTAVSPTPLMSLPFLSGWRPEEHALSRFHARYYPLTLLFLAFDVEMLYMYPWAT